MISKVILISNKKNEIKNFLEKFENKKIEPEDSYYWKQEFSNPIEITEMIAVFVDNINLFNIMMWITLDKNVYIKISPLNSNDIIKYLFERYPY